MLTGLLDEIGNPTREVDREGQEACPYQAHEQLLTPIGLLHFRKNANVVVEQITEAAGREQHEQANAGPSQKHHDIYRKGPRSRVTVKLRAEHP
jgi:hypothetical protein